MLLLEESGELVPWAGAVARAATLSQIRLRESQVAKLAELSSVQEPAWERLHSIGQVCTAEELIADFTRQLEHQPGPTPSMQERDHAS